MQSGGGNNLNISIGVDTAKFSADMARANAIMRDALRKLNAAARDELKTGQRGSAVETLSAGFAKASQEVARLKQQAGGLAQAVVPGTLRIEAGFKGITESVATVASSFRALRYGIVAGVVVEGLKKVSDAVTSLAEKTDILNKFSAATGFDTTTIQAFQRVLEATGVDAGEAGKMLFALSKTFSATRLEAERAGKSLGSGMRILRGGAQDQLQSGVQIVRGGDQTMRPGPQMMRVMRGSEIVAPPEIKDAASAYKALDINVAAYNLDLAGQEKLLVDVAAGLQKWKDEGRIDVANQIGLEIFTKQYQEVAAALEQLAKPGTLERAKAALKGTGQLITPADKEAVEAYAAAWRAFTDQTRGAATETSRSALPAATTALTDKLTPALQELRNTPGEIAKAWDDTGKIITSGTELVTNNLKDAWSIWGVWFNDFAQSTAANFNAAMATVALPPAGGAAPTDFGAGVGVSPFASGGFVSGPGTGTSDSILARLSAGEFVLNAASVRRLGISFLRGLNSFAAGGLVGSLPRFADGGMVATGGGTPVHLHLGSGSFALHGSSNVVEALVVEAHRQQMRSAGTKPSWFAARPSGR